MGLQWVSSASYTDTISIHAHVDSFLLLACSMCSALFSTASVDYTRKSVDLVFGPSSRKRCALIPVLNDMVPEVPEHFSVFLSMRTPLAGVILTPNNATVVINDDDGECM